MSTKQGLFFADIPADLGYSMGSYLNELVSSFEEAAEQADHMFDVGADDDGVVYIYELVLVGKVSHGKPVVERV